MKDRIVLKAVKNDTQSGDCQKCHLDYGNDNPICRSCEEREYYELDTSDNWISVDKPKYETPEQYKQRTGKDYPDDAPVYYRWIEQKTWHDLLFERIQVNVNNPECIIVIANENGKPPANYKPVCPECGDECDDCEGNGYHCTEPCIPHVGQCKTCTDTNSKVICSTCNGTGKEGK